MRENKKINVKCHSEFELQEPVTELSQDKMLAIFFFFLTFIFSGDDYSNSRNTKLKYRKKLRLLLKPGPCEEL